MLVDHDVYGPYGQPPIAIAPPVPYYMVSCRMAWYRQSPLHYHMVYCTVLTVDERCRFVGGTTRLESSFSDSSDESDRLVAVEEEEDMGRSFFLLTVGANAL